jgi:hypothetical protein
MRPPKDATIIAPSLFAWLVDNDGDISLWVRDARSDKHYIVYFDNDKLTSILTGFAEALKEGHGIRINKKTNS